MGKPSTSVWVKVQRKRWALMILLVLSVSTVVLILVRSSFDSCSIVGGKISSHQFVEEKFRSAPEQPNPLDFTKSKLVLLVSHELSLSGCWSDFIFFIWVLRKNPIFFWGDDGFLCDIGGPLLLMELAFLLRGVGAEVVWITNQKPLEADEVIYSLEHKMLDRGVQVSSLLFQRLIFCFILTIRCCQNWDSFWKKEHHLLLIEHFLWRYWS